MDFRNVIPARFKITVFLHSSTSSHKIKISFIPRHFPAVLWSFLWNTSKKYLPWDRVTWSSIMQDDLGMKVESEGLKPPTCFARKPTRRWCQQAFILFYTSELYLTLRVECYVATARCINHATQAVHARTVLSVTAWNRHWRSELLVVIRVMDVVCDLKTSFIEGCLWLSSLLFKIFWDDTIKMSRPLSKTPGMTPYKCQNCFLRLLFLFTIHHRTQLDTISLLIWESIA